MKRRFVTVTKSTQTTHETERQNTERQKKKKEELILSIYSLICPVHDFMITESKVNGFLSVSCIAFIR